MKFNKLIVGLAACAFTENGRRANLVADALDAGPAQVDRILQPLQRAEGRQLAAGAQQARRHVDQELVDQALAHQRAVELVAGLDVQLGDTAVVLVIVHAQHALAMPCRLIFRR